MLDGNCSKQESKNLDFKSANTIGRVRFTLIELPTAKFWDFDKYQAVVFSEDKEK